MQKGTIFCLVLVGLFVSNKLLLIFKVHQEVYRENFISKWYKISIATQHTHDLLLLYIEKNNRNNIKVT